MGPLTFGSLFAGIGGFDLGLERAGMRCAWQVEIDPYASVVLARHWPSVPRFRDVREVGAQDLARVDAICGGFPCQDISHAGKRAGITEGKRSGLWREFARLVGELRPSYVLVENVAALLVRGLDVVLGDLAALGYDAEWDCVPASAVGAPHRRDRVFLVAYAASLGRGEVPERFPAQGGTARAAQDLPQGSEKLLAHAAGEGRARAVAGEECAGVRAALSGREDVADPHGAGLPGAGDTGAAGPGPGRIFARPAVDRGGWWATEPDVGRVADGVPSRVDRVTCLGNAIVPQVAEHVGRCIVGHARRVR